MWIVEEGWSILTPNSPHACRLLAGLSNARNRYNHFPLAILPLPGGYGVGMEFLAWRKLDVRLRGLTSVAKMFSPRRRT